MLKRIFIILTIIDILILNFSVTYADDILDNENIEVLEVINTSAEMNKEPEINSRVAIIYDRKSKEVIWGKKENERRKMASTTKIMTAIVILEKCDLSEIVTISKKAAGIGGSRLGLKTNDKVSVKDLLYGLLLVSGNDAAVALAEHTAGSIEGFANLMNDKAKVLGLENSNFVTPHGLDSEEHYTTAYELALITDYALENKVFAKIVNTKSYTVNINENLKNISNTNELLGNLNGVNGVKTGFTNGANRCLVTSVNRNDMNIITVVLGADTKKFRTTDSVKLIEYAYSNYKNVKITDLVNEKYNEWKEKYEKDITITKGIEKRVQSKLEELEKEYITIKNGEENDIYVKINTISKIDAPMEKDYIIGNIKVYVNNEMKISINIINDRKINKKNLIDQYEELFIRNFKNMCKVS